MQMCRREFVAVGLAGAAGLCVGGYAPNGVAAEPPVQLPDEDGYKLWLRYAPPGDAAKNYRNVVRQIRVEGTSATAGVIRDELRSAFKAMLGDAVPLNEGELQDGTVIIAKPDLEQFRNF